MITFGIITNKDHHSATLQKDRLNKILGSIYQQNIPKYEIIIVGDYQDNDHNIRCIAFDDSFRKGWISKKKNIITKEAKNDIIVYLHDYITFDKNWFFGFTQRGYDWDIQMNVIENKDGTRFRDWCVYLYDGNVGQNGAWIWNIPKTGHKLLSPYLPDYGYTNTKNLYVSGSYWIAKRELMLKEPIDEDFVWGEPEDIEWSYRVLPRYKYIMNVYCKVKLLHQKDKVWSAISPYFESSQYIKDTHDYYHLCCNFVKGENNDFSI